MNKWCLLTTIIITTFSCSLFSTKKFEMLAPKWDDAKTKKTVATELRTLIKKRSDYFRVHGIQKKERITTKYDIHNPLIHCVQLGLTNLLAWCLSNGWSPIEERDHIGATALHHAACCEDDEKTTKMANLLLKKHHNLIVNLPDNQGNTPLCHAAAHGALTLVKILRRRGAFVNPQNGYKYLARAVGRKTERGSIRTVEIHDHARNGSPLFLALQGGHNEVAKYLKKHGARKNKIASSSDYSFSFSDTYSDYE